MSQIKTKFIEDNAANDLKVRLRSGQYLRSRNQANNADLNLWRINTDDMIEAGGEMSMDGNLIHDVTDPVDPQDAATKAYVDNVSSTPVILSVDWVESGFSPVFSVTGNHKVYSYEADIVQYLYATIRVPSSYTPGNPINLSTTFFSAATTGTGLLNTIATLIRTGVDAYNDSTNQRTSTNAAITLSGATSNIPQSVTCDLTDANGEINGVAVSPGDLIQIQLGRGSDTSTEDLNALVTGTEITFL